MDDLDYLKNVFGLTDNDLDDFAEDDDEPNELADFYKKLVRVYQDMYDKLLTKYSNVLEENENLRMQLKAKSTKSDTCIESLHCEKCGNEMVRQDIVLTSYPVQYCYKCPVCGELTTSYECYPKVVAKRGE